MRYTKNVQNWREVIKKLTQMKALGVEKSGLSHCLVGDGWERECDVQGCLPVLCPGAWACLGLIVGPVQGEHHCHIPRALPLHRLGMGAMQSPASRSSWGSDTNPSTWCCKFCLTSSTWSMTLSQPLQIEGNTASLAFQYFMLCQCGVFPGWKLCTGSPCSTRCPANSQWPWCDSLRL